MSSATGLLVSLRMQYFKLILIACHSKLLKWMIWGCGWLEELGRTYFWFACTNVIRYATGVPSSSEYLLLTRRYYVHKTYN